MPAHDHLRTTDTQQTCVNDGLVSSCSSPRSRPPLGWQAESDELGSSTPLADGRRANRYSQLREGTGDGGMTAGALAGPAALTALLAAGAVLVAELSSRSTSRTVAVVLALALVSAVLTALLVVDPYPWSNVLVLGVAWSGGILYGRVPGRWFAGLLIVLALLDLASFASGVQSQGGPSPSASPNFVSNLTVLWTGGHFREGILDIAVLVGTAARWTRTWRPGTVLVLALLAALAPSGLVAAGWRGGLPLVPFMAAVYASSVVVTRWPGATRWRRPTSDSAWPGTKEAASSAPDL